MPTAARALRDNPACRIIERQRWHPPTVLQACLEGISMGRFQRRLVKLVVGVVHFPKLTLVLCGLMLAASVGFALVHLQLSTDEDDLLPPKLPFFREYKKFSNAFPENDSFIIILEPLTYDRPPPAA